MNIRLLEGHGYYAIQKVDTGETILVQTDWDYPSLASSFGWNIRETNGGVCLHSGTDGTIKCQECGATAGEFIQQADNYLADNVGKVVADPGYFTND